MGKYNTKVYKIDLQIDVWYREEGGIDVLFLIHLNYEKEDYKPDYSVLMVRFNVARINTGAAA